MTLPDLLDAGDMQEMYPIVKYMHRIAFEEGTVLSKQAMQEAHVFTQ